MYPDFIQVTDLPVLDIGDKKGHTGYIDFIQVKDMSHSAMQGIDAYGRFFIALKYSDHETQRVGTFFQRYSNENSWAYGTCYWSSLLYHNSRVRQESYNKLKKRLTDLINGKTVKGTDCYGEDTEIDIKLV